MVGIEREKRAFIQLGHESMAEGQKITPEMLAGAKKTGKPMVFALDKDYRLDEGLINTYNGREGALPGMVEKDTTYDEGYDEEEAEEITQEETEGGKTPDSYDYGKEEEKQDTVVK